MSPDSSFARVIITTATRELCHLNIWCFGAFAEITDAVVGRTVSDFYWLLQFANNIGHQESLKHLHK